jgi:hypothetical protein
MIKTIVLGPVETPLVKTYNDKDNVVAINKHTNSTDFILANKVSPYNHAILTNGKVRNVISVISSEKEMTKEQIIKIVNTIPI